MDENINYVWAAFKFSLNRWFFLACILGLIFVPELRSSYFFAAAAGFEILYLISMSRIPGFRRIIRAKYSAKYEKKRRREFLNERYKLKSQFRSRHDATSRLINNIKNEYGKFSYSSKTILESNISSLENLYFNYVKMLVSLQKINQYMENTEKDNIAQQVKDLGNEIKTNDGKLKDINATRLDILKKRLDRYDSAKGNIPVLEAQLSTLEEALKLLYDQIVTIKDPTEITAQINSILDRLETTETAVREIEAFIDLDETSFS